MKKKLLKQIIFASMLLSAIGPAWAMEATRPQEANQRARRNLLQQKFEKLKDDWKCLVDRKRKCTWQQKARVTTELMGLILLLSGAYIRRKSQAQQRAAGGIGEEGVRGVAPKPIITEDEIAAALREKRQKIDIALQEQVPSLTETQRKNATDLILKFPLGKRAVLTGFPYIEYPMLKKGAGDNLSAIRVPLAGGTIRGYWIINNELWLEDRENEVGIANKALKPEERLSRHLSGRLFADSERIIVDTMNAVRLRPDW